MTAAQLNQSVNAQFRLADTPWIGIDYFRELESQISRKSIKSVMVQRNNKYRAEKVVGGSEGEQAKTPNNQLS